MIFILKTQMRETLYVCALTCREKPRELAALSVVSWSVGVSVRDYAWDRREKIEHNHSEWIPVAET